MVLKTYDPTELTLPTHVVRSKSGGVEVSKETYAPFHDVIGMQGYRGRFRADREVDKQLP